MRVPDLPRVKTWSMFRPKGQPGGQVVRRVRLDASAVRELAEHGREGAAVQITHHQHGFGGGDFPCCLLQIGLPRGGQFRVDGWWRVQGEQASAVQFRLNEREGFARIRFGHDDAATLQRPPAPKRQCKRAVVAVFAAVRIGFGAAFASLHRPMSISAMATTSGAAAKMAALSCAAAGLSKFTLYHSTFSGGAAVDTSGLPNGQHSHSPPANAATTQSQRCRRAATAAVSRPQNRVVRQKMREQFGKPKRDDLADSECDKCQPRQKREAARQPRAKGVFERHIDK